MKTRVVQVVTRLELGGAQQVVLSLARGLDRGRYDVSLVSGGRDRLTDEARALMGGDFMEVPELVRHVSPASDALAFAKLYVIFRRYVKGYRGRVVVHTHSSKAGVLGRLAARLAGAGVIVHTVHGFGFNDEQSRFRRGLFMALEKAASAVCDRIIAVARENIRKGVGCGIFPEEKAVVVRCGIDPAFFDAPPPDIEGKRKELGIPPSAPVGAMISCLKPQKAPVDFVRVAAKVLDIVQDAHFIHAGDGELRGAVLEEAERLGISDRFHLLGWRSDVRELIHVSDVIVLTSLWEGLPLVLPQAMACGKPVVATAVDGTPEAIKDGVNGFLARPHEVELMAEKVSLLLRDNSLAARMGAAGREMVSEFDDNEMLRRIEALYDALLKEAL